MKRLLPLTMTVFDGNSMQDTHAEIETADGDYVALDIDPDKAAFIVRACNSHDELVEALRALFQECSMVHKQWGANTNIKEADAAIAAARTALANAEGKE